MILPGHPEKHLSYCTNIHPGEDWRTVFSQLKSHLPNLKQRLSPDKPFGIGLRLSARAAEELLKDDHIKEFKNWLDDEALYVFTMNGFPYGSFHGEKVKDDVYKPDWSTKERVEYSSNLIEILANLLPDEAEGSISTSPISYKYWGQSAEKFTKIKNIGSIHLAQLAWQMAEVFDENGKEIHIDIEPEPDCLIENSEELIRFYNHYLLPKGSEFLMNEHQITAKRAEEILRRHIGVCYDTCHFALEYENPAEAIQSFVDEGIRIGKTQISAALKVKLDDERASRPDIADHLQQFDEPTYLHQVIVKTKGGGLVQFRDLPEALPSIENQHADEWRIHFHVPVFLKKYEELYSTQDEMMESLQIILDGDHCKHFEIETYTWDVLPDELKTNVTDSIERELRWILDAIQ
ncbi:metabolite traffic protein EboE [Rhodohalobacter sulfatireducens]|uniref:Metabolite traffic protein EboE n=1 Tax=Rhodohalobacter sulfatireducens TaxID=2911366 RepID=A0ABS9KG23_9BACT|nr:metabolite traffic protein EboE [Rhodohalobacter sulfatireducens]MCG2589808.1 metabolite traffic protein EboE [Rhodohalobacter sulfatireducens]